MNKTKRDAIRKRLQELSEQNDGRITPDLVVKDAKKKTSPMHGEFDWNVQKAANAHWLHQARQLISSVRVVITNETRTISTVRYVRDPSVPAKTQGYIAIAELKSDHELARESLLYEFGRAATALKRARDLAAALDMMEDVDEIIHHVAVLNDRAIEFEITTVQ